MLRPVLRLATLAPLAVLLTAFFTPTSSAAPPPTGPDGGTAGAVWAATEDGPQTYPNVAIDWDVPIRMSDGVVLKANVYHPADAAGRAITTPTPTIVNLTPYTKLASMLVDVAQSIPVLSPVIMQLARSIDLTGTPLSGITDLTKALGGGALRAFTVDRQLIRSGYTQVVADVRGTGFSEGDWDVFGQREQQDTLEVIDWAAHQPWSNGRIGMNGASYSGLNQIQAAEKDPPALRAIFPLIAGNDPIGDLLATGGSFGVGFVPAWLLGVNGLKLIPDVSSILRGNFDMKWLMDRAADPFTYFDALITAMFAPRIQDLSPDAKQMLDANSSQRKAWLGDPAQIHTPTFLLGGWHDVFDDDQLRMYNQMPLPPGQKQVLMGDTYHINPGSESGKPGLPPRIDVLQRAWFDHWLKGIDNGIQDYGPITVRQQGGRWVTEQTFGTVGVDYRRMYLSAVPSHTSALNAHDGSLLPRPSADNTTLTVAPNLSSLCSRDAAQVTAGVLSVIDGCARDSRIQEIGGLTFTSAPVASPTTLQGPMNLHLNAVEDAIDGYWTATVNDVAPDGTSTVLSTGQLMASLRQINPARSRRAPNGDYIQAVPYLDLGRRQPTVPGQPTQLDMEIFATSAVLAPGHRLRVDVYASNFPKGMPFMPLLLDTGLKPEHLLLDPRQPSYLTFGTAQGGW